MHRISIHSVPRSGSSWLGEILNSSELTKYCYQPLFSYALKNSLSASSSIEEVNAFFENCLHSKDQFINQTEKRASGILPNFHKSNHITHIVYKEVRYHNILENLFSVDKDIKLIALIRNPLAVMASWFAAPKEFHPSWDRASEWYSGKSKNSGREEEFWGFQRWVDAAQIFHDLKARYPNRVIIVKYADLLADLDKMVERIMDFSELAISAQTKEFLCGSRETDIDDPYSVFRTTPSDEKWKESLDRNIVSRISDCLKGDPLSEYLLG